ncbi:DEAD/DEAH box helicase [Enterococcus sp.]|uniref:DEAD/DEAH box helicase n=1 Tax=Enterococcus sp. TaxID=35783 RepID=UPI002FC94CFF
MREIVQNFDDCFKLANEISINEEGAKLINVIENWEYVHEGVRPVFLDLIESFGFYPYLREKDKLDTAALIRNEYHRSEYLTNNEGESLTFHLEQKILEEKISQKVNLLVSAPTSFGKSLLIEEFVARKQYKNIVIIQPTLALIDETRRKLKKYDDFYNIIVNTGQDILENNLFILTSERVLDMSSKIESVDLFIVDEFYKISNRKKDERVSHLNIAFYKILKRNPQLLLLTPNIDSVNNEFINKYNLEFFRTEYCLVNQDVKKISFEKRNKQQVLFELLEKLEEPTIVYVKSPNQAEKIASAYLDSYATSKERSFPIFEWIDENISPNWGLKKFLRNGIGLHNGQYPRHIVNSQLDYFNSDKLKVIFATTSLIEGVNTVAKNIIIYDMRKGIEAISYFDFNNIKGRAGRMMKYYTGKIYYFDTPPKKQIENLDIPIIEQEEGLQSEILVNLDKADIKEQRIGDYQLLVNDVPKELLEIFKKNYYDIEKQKNLYSHLILNPSLLNRLSWTTATPTQASLLETLETLNHHLDGQKGQSHKFTAQKCQQVMRNNLRQAIASEINYQRGLSKNSSKKSDEIENLSIAIVFRFIKNQAKYEIPKKLKILESIVNYISGMNRADYSSFIAMLEHEGVNEELSILLDFGVPSSALKKFTNLPNENSLDYIRENIAQFQLSKYELEIVKKVI